ncbi:hypothetical protein [Natronoglomus mannanivorans]|uniref:Uncharacterized protein n=1 Tax=Natronoglomus mannanivorans TaxID=2979990 RepID=A0AAP2Z2M9_9EURY|nr:hypothetical protein [Halobacteria archaeon AArc-xg1-1]
MPDKESREKTVGTILLFIIWGAIVLGPMFIPWAEAAPYEIAIGTTAVAFTILGKMWGFQGRQLLNGITISTDGGRRPEDDRDDE